MRPQTLLTVLSSTVSLSLATPALNVLSTTTTPNGFTAPPRGWNSYGIQANPATTPWFVYNQTSVITQCDELASTLAFLGTGQYCSLDSGWSVGGNGDEYGRIIYDDSIFDLPTLADHLHAEGLLLGVYVVPGAFEVDANKTIYGTDIVLGSTWNGWNNGLGTIEFDFSKPGAQEWHNSVVNLFAEWGVDLIKLDYITPGSPSNGVNLEPDNNGTVVAYHRAIAQASRPMRLDISWKLERNATYYDIWRATADSMRTDQDINNSGSAAFLDWATVQRAIEQYREYVALQTLTPAAPLSIYPDMDNMYIGNTETVSGVTDQQRQTVYTHWLGAGANLLLGSDLTTLDSWSFDLLNNTRAQGVAAFAAQYPMQPRNPGTGNNSSQQLQAWIGGPAENGTAVVVLVNLGPDQGSGGFGTELEGTQTVSASWGDLGIEGSYDVYSVWQGADLGTVGSAGLSVELGEGECQLYVLTPV